MATEVQINLVRRLGQSPLLDPAQRQELTGPLQAQFPDPKALLREVLRREWLTLYQVQEFLNGREAGLVLGPYILLDKLGEGGCGQVFKARHHRLQRVTALKVVRADLAADAEVVARFDREIEVISQLAHPNLVHAYDVDLIGTRLVLAMEYVAGVDLDRLVKEQGPLPVRTACDYIRQAASGLAYAHERGLVHRDIKPANLLVAQGQGLQSAGLVKILDLGLARLRQPAASSRTRNLTVLAGSAVMQGTPDYQAPEQAIDFHSADIRADIYSLGCTFYYLLVGQPPFDGSLAEKLLKHHQAEPRPVTDFRGDVPEDLLPILGKMLAKRPAERYQTPAELARDLEGLLAALPGAQKSFPTIDAQHDKTPANLQVRLPQKGAAPNRGKRRRALLVILGSVVLLAGGSWLAWSFLGRDGSPMIADAVPSGQTVATTSAPPTPGLRYAYYQGEGWGKLPSFDNLLPFKTGTVPNFTLAERQRNENFAFVFTGYLRVEKPGKYTFVLTSDDGSRLRIGDKVVIDHDGLHSPSDKSGALDLTAGKHPIRVEYFQAGGEHVLKLHWQAPGMATKQLIPDAVLQQNP